MPNDLEFGFIISTWHIYRLLGKAGPPAFEAANRQSPGAAPEAFPRVAGHLARATFLYLHLDQGGEWLHLHLRDLDLGHGGSAIATCFSAIQH